MHPPIPLRLADRPTVGGLVIPWISVQHADGSAHLGAVHGSRVDTCLNGRCCQTCGEHLGARVVLFARPADFARGYVAEPALHPECAAYSAKACPMVAGTMTHYRKNAPKVAGRPCDKPGCGCAGWVDTDGQDARAGADAEPWFAVWIRLADYRTAVDQDGRLIGIALRDVTPLKVRPLNPLAEQHKRMFDALVASRELLGIGDGP